MLKNYFKIAWRNLLRQKTYGLINIGGLAVAMTAAVLILMWVQNELRFDNYHPAADRIYLVKNYLQVNEGDTRVIGNSPYLLKDALKSEVPEAEEVTLAYHSHRNDLTLEIDGTPFNERGLYVDESWFEVFRYDFIEGSPQLFFAHPYSLILTESKAKTFFGSTRAVGRTLRIDSTEFMVRGVVNDNPVNSSFQYDLLIPMAAELDRQNRRVEVINWRYLTCNAFLRLRPNADAEKTAGTITGLFRANREEDDLRATLLPLKDLRFDQELQSSAFKHVDIQTVKLFGLLAVLLLLTASINYVNLSVARAGLRSKEISVRKVSGAGRKALFLQLMAESVLTGSLALAFTIVLVWMCLPFFNAFTDMRFTLNPLEPHLTEVLLGTLLAVVLLTGTYPALLLSSLNPANLLRGANIFRIKDHTLRKGLIVGQFTFAVIMTVAAITVYRQLSFVQQQDPGYNRAQMFTMRIPHEAFAPVIAYLKATEFKGGNPPDILSPFKEELLGQSSVRHVTRMMNTSVIDEGYVTSGRTNWDGKAPDFNPKYTSILADADLNKIMNFELVEGRWFDSRRPSDYQNVVLNETAVRQFGLREPVVGKRFNEGRIIGVVKDFHYQSLHEKIGPVVIQTKLPTFASTLMVETEPGRIGEAIQTAASFWRRNFPGQPFRYSFLDDEFEELYRNDRKALSFTMVFSVLSILISCLGLLGMIVFAAQQRRKEIGIRKVLGATVAGIATFLSKDLLKLVTIAIFIAVPIAWYVMSRWLENFAYRIELDWWIFALAGLLAVIIALLTVSLQSVKAALMNPIKSLRSE